MGSIFHVKPSLLPPTPGTSTKYKLNFDFGVAQIAGQIYGSGPTGVNLQARHQIGVQVSYGF